MDVQTLAENWWAIALRGVAAIVFGILTLLLPAISLVALVWLFGAYAVVEGVFAIVAAVSRASGGRFAWALLLEGLVGVAAGVVAFVWPEITALALLYVIAAWAIVTGVLEIVAAVRLRERITNEWWLVLSGILSVVFGGLAVIFPGAGALAIVMWIGAYAVVFGALLLALAFRLRGVRDETEVLLRRAA
jgi:uncharacterized membrane protein HdeD (DUF308 family)